MAEPTYQGAPACGLYIRVAPDFDLLDTVPKLRNLFFITTKSKYEKNMHILELPVPTAEDGSLESVRGLAELGRSNGFVVILRGPATMVESLGMDGVLLEQGGDIAAARTILGEDGIIGVRCGLARHEAQRALDADADFVTFHAGSVKTLPPTDIFSWWSTHSDILALAEGPITNDDCGVYVRAGASFIEATAYILDHPAGVKQGAVDMMYAIELATEKRTIN